jgi:hypothetical protein
VSIKNYETWGHYHTNNTNGTRAWFSVQWLTVSEIAEEAGHSYSACQTFLAYRHWHPRNVMDCLRSSAITTNFRSQTTIIFIWQHFKSSTDMEKIWLTKTSVL